MSAHVPQSVRIVFDEYGWQLSYAADLSRALGVPLHVHAPVRPEVVECAAALAQRLPRELDFEMALSVREEAHRHFRDPLRARVLVSLADVPHRGVCGRSILVSCDTESRTDLDVLSPAGERKVFRANKGPILVPLGDGEGSLEATRVGIALAKALDTTLSFWHTTWKDPGEPDPDPRKHLAPKAAAIIREAERLAKEAGVTESACRIECAATVVESIIRVALYSGASLIVMSRGRRKRFGAYPERVRGRNCPVPLLTLAKGRP